MIGKATFVGILALISVINADLPCEKLSFQESSFVCVCNSQYCDTLSPIENEPNGTFLVYTSDKAENRLTLTKKDKISPGQKITNSLFNYFSSNTTTITINRAVKLQEIIGFGGAFTDATTQNIATLTNATQQKLLESYFHETGIEYNIGRVPMGGTDFSNYGYSYCDTTDPDPTLSNFTLQKEDDAKAQYIKQAQGLKRTVDDLQLFASIWTAPKWMKTNNKYNGGAIKDEYYQTWADYFLKFFEKYEERGISFWGVTTGNEPSLALVNSDINSVRWLPAALRKWVGENLGPTIRGSKFKDLKIITLDDQRFFLPWYPEEVMKNGTENFIDGIAVHWYWDILVPASLLTMTHKKFPDKLLLATEACRGDKSWEKAVLLGDWSRAEDYAHGMLEDLNNYVQSWVDWNMVLDSTGGPTYIGNNVDAPIITDPTNDRFFKQPMFYAQGHFSKFIPRGSHKLSQEISNKNVEAAAFERKDGGVAVVVMNKKKTVQNVVINDEKSGHIDINLQPNSINTIIYW